MLFQILKKGRGKGGAGGSESFRRGIQENEENVLKKKRNHRSVCALSTLV